MTGSTGAGSDMFEAVVGSSPVATQHLSRGHVGHLSSKKSRMSADHSLGGEEPVASEHYAAIEPPRTRY